ncbi:hypothetical protein KRR55_10200 [Paeniglutamicibacter sp. ABSL32-1]|uniref:hypothetical protein n=1 Tax=Paeniglutamicibacter quisquiliarum TaxID=2849498 RepID=UPI001C2D17B3|nr:hypothetical protein [Paeniglutamicibacter quisquiliarum]MBV1779480.1 hypothetical protein [Paeniglutamicibacter quisquiliarum]
MKGHPALTPPATTFRHHKPKPFAPMDFDPFEGGADPARVSEAAHLSAHALVQAGKLNEDPAVRERLVRLAEDEGLEVIAELWSKAPARSLPGALWRLYAIRAATVNNPEAMASFFAAGARQAQVERLVAGAAEPPGAEELCTMTSSILTGAFEGEFDVALERTAAYCRVIALGQAEQADAAEPSHPDRATLMTSRAHALLKTAEDLESAAASWRRGELD